MNILLIHLNPLGVPFQIGLSYIASVLKKKGHSVDFLFLPQFKKDSLVNKISRNNSEIIILSVTSDSVNLCKRVVKFINTKYNIPILLGGVHPTLCPEELMGLKGVLGICIGEGEYPVRELIDAIEKRSDCTDIKNLWVKKDGVIYKNDLRPLIQNLDELPFPDYSIFKEYAKFRTLPVILSRGCPFTCSYCCNHALKKIYNGKGDYTRFHSVSYSLKLITGLLDQFTSVERIEFYDDTFTVDGIWLDGFLKEFSKLGIKFICNSRFDLLDDSLIKLLARSNCVRINAAVECGNEKIRKDILKRNIKDNNIIETSKLLKKYNIRLHTHNMVGLPYETEQDMLKTIDLNKQIKADSAQISIFRPYKRTELAELCQEKHWIDSKLEPASYRDFTMLNTPFVKPHIVNYYFLIFKDMIFERGIRLYLKKLYFWMIHFRNNRIYIFIRNRKIRF